MRLINLFLQLCACTFHLLVRSEYLGVHFSLSQPFSKAVGNSVLTPLKRPEYAASYTGCDRIAQQDILPERDHVAQFGGQTAELIGRQVQVDQVGQLGDVGRDASQVVVVDVQRRQVG